MKCNKAFEKLEYKRLLYHGFGYDSFQFHSTCQDLSNPGSARAHERQFDSLAKRPQIKLVWDTHCHSNKASNTNNTLPKCLCIQNDGMQTILEQGYKLSAHKNYFVSLVALAVCPQHRHLSTAWRSPGMEYRLSLDNENVCFANCSSELSFCQRLGMSW